MRTGYGYSKELAQENYDAIIIGSGLSGLTTGALLSQQGKRVLIIEKHFRAGGFTHTFRRKDYEWDVGIHYIGDVHKPYSFTRKLFDSITDNKLKWNKMGKTYDRMIFPYKSYDFTEPRSQFVEDMKKHFPAESDAIDKYMTLLDEVHKVGKKYFAGKIFSGVLGKVVTSFLSKDFNKFSDKTTKEVISSITDDKELLGVLAGQWGDHGLPPGESSFVMHAMVARHYLDGGNYPVGGSRSIAETIVPVIEKQGGRVLLGKGVDEIIIDKGKAVGVKMGNGNELSAPIIISSAGVANTLGKFLRNEPSLAQYTQKLNTLQPSTSYVCLYMGLQKTAEELGLESANLWVYPSYDHDKNIADFAHNFNAECPVVYISFPSTKDPDWEKNHPGTSTIEAITMAPYDWFKKWKDEPWKQRGKEYEDFKAMYSEKILDVIYKHVPAVKENIDFHELSTPLSVRDLANYPEGELYGMDHPPSRFRQKWLQPATPIKNLFLTGQDITTVGISGALASGLLTASVVLKKNLSKEIFKK